MGAQRSMAASKLKFHNFTGQKSKIFFFFNLQICKLFPVHVGASSWEA